MVEVLFPFEMNKKIKLHRFLTEPFVMQLLSTAMEGLITLWCGSCGDGGDKRSRINGNHGGEEPGPADHKPRDQRRRAALRSSQRAPGQRPGCFLLYNGPFIIRFILVLVRFRKKKIKTVGLLAPLKNKLIRRGNPSTRVLTRVPCSRKLSSVLQTAGFESCSQASLRFRLMLINHCY